MRILRIIGGDTERTDEVDRCLLGIEGAEITTLAFKEKDPGSPVADWRVLDAPRITRGATTTLLAAYESYARRAEIIFSHCVERRIARPDIILNRGGGGCAFLLRELWGKGPRLVTYFDYFPTSAAAWLPHISDPRVRTSQALLRHFLLAPHLLDLLYCDIAHTFSVQQHGQLPVEWSQKARIIPEPIPVPDGPPGTATADSGERLVSVEAEGRTLDPRALCGMLAGLARMCADERIPVRFALLGRHPATERVRHTLREAGAPLTDATGADAAGRAAIWRRATIHVHWTSPTANVGESLRAMAAGCLVCGTDLPPLREFIRHRRNGLLLSDLSSLSAASECLAVLREPARYARLGEAARDMVRTNHHPDRLRPRYEALLRGVL